MVLLNGALFFRSSRRLHRIYSESSSCGCQLQVCIVFCFNTSFVHLRLSFITFFLSTLSLPLYIFYVAMTPWSPFVTTGQIKTPWCMALQVKSTVIPAVRPIFALNLHLLWTWWLCSTPNSKSPPHWSPRSGRLAHTGILKGRHGRSGKCRTFWVAAPKSLELTAHFSFFLQSEPPKGAERSPGW